MSFINLDIIRFNWIPWFWRNPTNNAVSDAYSGSLGEVNDRDADLEVIEQKVLYSAEKILLEAYCNDVFDDVLRRIFIGQTVNSNDVFLGLDAESPNFEIYMGLDSESPTYETFLFLDSESGSVPVVQVNVPVVLSLQNDLIKQGVENYVRIPAIVEIVNF